jgi:xanthine dehydrogenase accessory factor
MSDWIDPALSAVRRGETLAMVTVVTARGSTPRERGARMLVWPERFQGTIGGGALERQGLDQARRLLAQGTRRHALQDYPLGPLLGQCCGGFVRLLVERLDAGSLDWLAAAQAAAGSGAAFRLSATFTGQDIRREVHAGEGEAIGEAEHTALAEVRAVEERIGGPRPRLAIFGAGHVGRAVASAFATLPFELDWLASREDLRPEAGGSRAAILSEDDLIAAVEAAPAETLFAIFTHSHDLDYRLTRAVLGRGDFRYLGLIGSATKRARFLRRLRDDGVPEAALARLTCPIGIVTLKSKDPAVIAVALAAQLLELTQDPGS